MTALGALGHVPDWILGANLGLRRAKTVRVGKAGTADFDTQALRRGQVIDIELAPEACLIKPVTVPKSASRKVGPVVDVFLSQALPGQGKGMVWRNDPPRAINGRLEMRAYVLKSTTLTRLLSQVAQAGAKVRTVSVEGAGNVSPFLDNRKALNRGGRGWLVLSMLGFVGVAGWLAWQDMQALNQSQTQLAQLRDARAELSAKAVELTEIAQATQGTRGSQQDDLWTLINAVRKTQLLANLTNITPSDIWLTELAIQRDAFRMSGVATGDVVAFLSEIQAAPWVQRATLEGPVRTDPFDGIKRFDLLVTLKPRELERVQ
ncbi:MAG: PilN domain-containing protein [Paracoccaceae bacterium]